MLTQQELSFMYKLLDEIPMQGIENKIMVVNIQQKLPLMLQAEQKKASDRLVEQALEAEREKAKEKAKRKRKKNAKT